MALATGLGPVAARAGAEGNAQFTINGSGGRQLTYAQIGARGNVDTDYQVSGRETRDLLKGTDAKRVVQLLGIAPESVTTLGASTSAGPPMVSITRAELLDGFAGDHDQNGHQLPAVFDAQSLYTVQFLRPLRSATDDNAGDQVNPGDGTLYVTIQTDGGQLPVSVTGPEHLALGEPGTFVAHAQVADGQDVVYSWDFDDGSAPSGLASASHGWSAPGSYDVYVTASTPGDKKAGSSQRFSVTVGDPTTGGQGDSPIDTGGAAGGGGGGAGGGSAASGGGGSGSAGSGPATTSGNGKKTTRTKKTGKKVPRAADEEAPSESATPAPPAAAPAPAAAASPAAPAGAPTTSTGALPTQPSPTTAPSTPSTTGAPAPTTPSGLSGSGGLINVRGVLASATATGTPAIRAALAAADALAKLPPEQQAPSRAAAGSSTSLAGWIGGGALLVGLLAVGAAREGMRASAVLRSS